MLEDETSVAIGNAVIWAAFHEYHHADPKCPLLQLWLRVEVLSSYEKEYGASMEDMHIPVQKVTVVPQGCRDEAHLIENGLDANGEQV